MDIKQHSILINTNVNTNTNEPHQRNNPQQPNVLSRWLIDVNSLFLSAG